jgi:excisionase family DNA binding protein
MGEWRVNLDTLLAYKKRFNPNFKSNLHNNTSLSAQDTSLDPVSTGHKDMFTKLGVEYISSADAADITGYSQDYVGQLARSGAIPAEKVGRKWFVSKSDLLTHKEHNDSLLAAVHKKSLGIANLQTSDKNGEIAIKKSNNVLISKIPTVTYKNDDGSEILPSANLANNTTYDDSENITRLTKSRTKIMDLQSVNRRYSTNTKVISGAMNMQDNIVRDDLYVTHKSIKFKLAKILYVVLAVIELMIISLALLFPDVIIGYIDYIVLDNASISMALDYVYELPLVNSILNVFNGYIIYK